MQKVSAGTVFLAFIAVLFGLLGVYAVRKIVQPRALAKEAPQRLVVPLASRNLKPGRVVTLSDVALVRLSREQMLKREIPKMFMSDPQQIIGQTVLTNIQRGKTFDTQNFYPQGFRPNVAEQLEVGERAITIKVSNEHGLGGYATAGQLVDIIFRFGDSDDLASGGMSSSGTNRTWIPGFGYHATPNSAGGGFDYTYEDRVRTRNGDAGGPDTGPAFATSTVTLMQGIKILALEENSVPDDAQEVQKDDPLRVTVAVTPEEAATLQLVQGHGSLVLSLRNPDDTEIVEPITTRSLEDLLGLVPNQPEALPRVVETEVFVGGSKSVRRFDSSHPLAIRQTGFGPEMKEAESVPMDTQINTKPISTVREDIFEMETVAP